jgi:ParB family transcriptional regulator, chromosome partitioning protein
MSRKSILGTPLGSLLSSPLHEEIDSPVLAAVKGKGHQVITYLSVEKLVRSPYQPRKEFDQDALNELADSIRSQGILQPIVVRPTGDGKHFEIIAGERRWRAAQLAELSEVPTIIREVSNETALALAIIENLQREGLSPLEEAMGFERLMTEFQLTHQNLAEIVGKSRAAITNLLRLLTLRPEVKIMLEHNDLEMGHAKALLGLEGPKQVEVARIVVARGLSVRQTEALVRQVQQHKSVPESAKQAPDPDVAALEQRLSEVLCAKVLIQHGNKGKGKLVITYSSLDELDGILAHIQ